MCLFIKKLCIVKHYCVMVILQKLYLVESHVGKISMDSFFFVGQFLSFSKLDSILMESCLILKKDKLAQKRGVCYLFQNHNYSSSTLPAAFGFGCPAANALPDHDALLLE